MLASSLSCSLELELRRLLRLLDLSPLLKKSGAGPGVWSCFPSQTLFITRSLGL